jgi:Flp pilus assembly protein TadD
MGDYYEKDAALAAKTIDSLKNEKVYLHCYLGVHRMSVVRGLLEKQGTTTGTYTVRGAQRTRDDQSLDSALYAYRKGDLKAATAYVDRIAKPDVPALMIRGWSQYRLNHIDRASNDFRTALSVQPTMKDAHNGLGYCMLRENHLDSAETHFRAVIESSTENPQAQAGLAMVHYRMGMLDDARQHLETSLSLDSSNTDARDLLMRIRRAQLANPLATH